MSQFNTSGWRRGMPLFNRRRTCRSKSSLPVIDQLERRMLMDGSSLSVLIGDRSADQGTTMHFTDGDGTHIYSTVKHGSAMYAFEGEGLYIAYMKTTICIYGVKITLP